MIKWIAALKFRADQPAETCRRYWIEQHGPMALELPGLQRYRQSHRVSGEDDFGNAPYDGFASLWFEDEAILYNLVTEIYRDRDVSDATFNAAVAKYGEKGVTEIVGLAGYYGITAMSLIAVRAPTAPGDEPKLQSVAQAFPK